MSYNSKPPIIPYPEPQRFSDYGFDTHFHYFQVLEEARKHKRESSSSRSIDSLHLKLQKPISKDDSSQKIKKSSSRKRWWNTALLFFKWKKRTPPSKPYDLVDDVGDHRRRRPMKGSPMYGPVYITESPSGSSTPKYRTSRRPSSGPRAGALTSMAMGKSEVVDIPYFNLRELSMDQKQWKHRISTPSTMPIYLVN